jgi:hypothetical protein
VLADLPPLPRESSRLEGGAISPLSRRVLTLEEIWEAEMVPEWRDAFIPYPRMRLVLKQLIQALGGPAAGPDGRPTLSARPTMTGRPNGKPAGPGGIFLLCPAQSVPGEVPVRTES